MIAKSYILENLMSLNSAFNRAASSKQALFFSKLAVLELCGWIEESMDDVILRCAVRSLKEPSNRTYIEKTVVERNYGFEYEKHFRSMLIRLIGLINVERVERAMDPTKKARLSSTLAALKKSRDSEAHTHIKGITKQINAPSVTLSQFYPVYDGLLEVDRVLRQSKL